MTILPVAKHRAMPSPAKTVLQRLCDIMPRFKSNKKTMADGDNFKVSATIAHRYQDPDVLRDCLVNMGFNQDQIKIRVSHIQAKRIYHC